MPSGGASAMRQAVIGQPAAMIFIVTGFLSKPGPSGGKLQESKAQHGKLQDRGCLQLETWRLAP